MLVQACVDVVKTCFNKSTESADLHLAVRTSFLLGPILLLLGPRAELGVTANPRAKSTHRVGRSPGLRLRWRTFKNTVEKLLKKPRGKKKLALRLSAKLKKNH